jgi:hypothetical protein
VGAFDFDAALDVYRRGRAKRDHYFKPVLEAYRSPVVDGKSELSPERFLKFLEDLLKARVARISAGRRKKPPTGRGLRVAVGKMGQHEHLLMSHLFRTRHRASTDLPADIECARRALALLNPQAREIVLTFLTDHRGNVLVLGPDANIRTITPLTGLPIHALDISGTAVTRIECLRGTPLRHLDISRTRVRNTPVLRDLPLRELRAVDCAAFRIKNTRTFPYLEALVVSRDSPMVGKRMKNAGRSVVRIVGEDETE